MREVVPFVVAHDRAQPDFVIECINKETVR